MVRRFVMIAMVAAATVIVAMMTLTPVADGLADRGERPAEVSGTVGPDTAVAPARGSGAWEEGSYPRRPRPVSPLRGSDPAPAPRPVGGESAAPPL